MLKKITAFLRARLKVLLLAGGLVVLVITGALVYRRGAPTSYAYTLAEFVQRQQTFSPYTKYEPSFAVDKTHEKIYHIYKAVDDDGVWQIFSATTDLNGNGWVEVQQTNTPENKQRPSIVYDSQADLIHYFYQTGSEMNAAEKIPRRLMTAVKSPTQEKWQDEKILIGDDGIDDTAMVLMDAAHRRLLLVYTKNQQITTARFNLETSQLDETVHTTIDLMSFIPNAAYDPAGDTIYVVFPRARTPRTFNNKDLWLATVKGDGSGYKEVRLTETGYDNTWPFITLDLPRQKFYLRFASFTEPTTYSEEGVANVKERLNTATASLDGTGFEVLLEKNGMSIYGVGPETGILYGTWTNPERYFVTYDPAKKKMKKQLIPSGDAQTYYDAAYRVFDPETKKLFGTQQVCRPVEAKGIECQIWTYHGRVLDGEKSSLTPQTTALMAEPQSKALSDLKLLNTEANQDKIKFNTNRKLSMPVWFTIESGGKEISWGPEQLEQIDQDRGVQLRFPQGLSLYTVTYKICALTDPEKGEECLEGTLSYP